MRVYAAKVSRIQAIGFLKTFAGEIKPGSLEESYHRASWSLEVRGKAFSLQVSTPEAADRG